MINLTATGKQGEEHKYSVLTHFFKEGDHVKVLKVLRKLNGGYYENVKEDIVHVDGMSLNDIIEDILGWVEEILNGKREI